MRIGAVLFLVMAAQSVVAERSSDAADIRRVQHLFSGEGCDVGKINGRLDLQTAGGIPQYLKDRSPRFEGRDTNGHNHHAPRFWNSKPWSMLVVQCEFSQGVLIDRRTIEADTRTLRFVGGDR